MKIKSYGKINLSLEIIGKRKDGYHDIDTLMNRIDLHDEIYLKEISGDSLVLKCDAPWFPLDEQNLIHKAWKIMSEYKSGSVGMGITVIKNIPVAAGLAGGTSNACEVMKALNDLWGLNLTNDELKSLSAPLGADSAFFFYDGLVRARGIGDIIDILDVKLNLPLLLINIGKPISSAEVYSKIENYSAHKVETLVKKLQSGDINFLIKNMYNSMEPVSFGIYPVLEEVKQNLKACGAEGVLMSGSGPTIFAIFKDETYRDMVYNRYFEKYDYVLKSKTI